MARFAAKSSRRVLHPPTEHQVGSKRDDESLGMADVFNKKKNGLAHGRAPERAESQHLVSIL